jgi:ABC-2 type transport system permease protein
MKIEYEAIYTVWLREVKKYFRQRERLISSLAQPIFFFLVFGLGLGPSFNLGLGISYTEFLAPGIIAMSLLFTSLFSGVSVIWDREFGFLKEMLVAPVSRVSIVIGRSIGGATTALIQGTIILALAAVLLGAKISLMSAIILLPIMAVISVGFVSLGITIASLMESIEGFQLIMNFLVLPMFFLSGALFPLNNLPGAFKAVVYIDPMTYGVEIMRFVYTGFSSIPPYITLAYVILFAVATSLIGSYAFSRRK